MHQYTFLLLGSILSLSHSTRAHNLEFINQCSYTIWPAGGTGDASSNLPANGGFELTPGATQSVTLTDNWNGRWWPRTHCTFDSAGAGKCLTGDCGGNIGCPGGYGAVPTTLAEFNLNGAQGYYDVSMVDGFNAPLEIRPLGGDNCVSPNVAQNINAVCPAELQIRNPSQSEVIACMSGCTAFGTPELCCTGAYNSQQTCQPSSYSEIFKKIAPTAYSYAWDSGTYFCNTQDYQIVFCPGGSGSGSATGSVVGGALNVANNEAAVKQTQTQQQQSTTTTSPAPTAVPATAYRANINLFSTSDSSCTGVAADSLSGIVADGNTCIQTHSLQYITVSCTSSTAEIKAYDTSDCSGASGLIIDTPLSQCQSNGDGTVSNGDATAHIVTCGIGAAPAIPDTPAEQQTSTETPAPTQPPAAAKQSSTSTAPAVLPAAPGHASVSSWTASTRTCAGQSTDSLVNIVADNVSCYPTNSLGWITVQCNNNQATLNSFSNSACSGSAALTQSVTSDTCDTTAIFSSTAISIHCGTASDNVSNLQQAVYKQPVNLISNQLPASTAKPVSTGVSAPEQILLTGLVFYPDVIANNDGTRSILFNINSTATPTSVRQSLSYVIAHYQIDQSYQQNIYQSASHSINNTFWFNLTQVPQQSLWYGFTVGDIHGVQLNSAINSLNQTVLQSLATTATPLPIVGQALLSA